ncbi:MAG: hypothetical protein WA919_13400 [Coleofasciculaceae cyanobacterium]
MNIELLIVQNLQILAFTIVEDESKQISKSQVLPGLKRSVLVEAL